MAKIKHSYSCNKDKGKDSLILTVWISNFV